jgi:hypothetical protein
MAHISLGLGPWLHQLRSGSLRLVRRLHSYYGLARLPTPVQHRLRLLAFPMRTAVRESRFSIDGQTWDLPASDAILLRVMCSSTSAGWAAPRITVRLMWRSAAKDNLRPQARVFRGSITHPTQPLCTLRVRHCCRLTQHSLPGGLLGLTWVGLAPTDRASFPGAFPLRTLRHLGLTAVQRGSMLSRTARKRGYASSQESEGATPTSWRYPPPPKRSHCTTVNFVVPDGSLPSANI